MEVNKNNLAQQSHIDVDKRTDFQTFINPQSINNINNQRIVTWINELHKSLDADLEVGIKIDHAGEQIVFHLDHIGHANPSMIYFKGHTESGDLVHFVKHQSQLNIELLKLKRRAPNAAKSPYGFSDWEAYEKNKYNIELD